MQQYYANKPKDVYLKQGIMTASPIELIIMLYDGCRKNLMQAERAVARNDNAAAHKHFIKAQDIISELVNSLDMRYEISEQLLDLYEFMLVQIADMNVSKKIEAMPPVLEMLETLRGTWQEIADKQQRGALSLSED